MDNDVKQDLPLAMVVAAFAGISWYIGLELNISLFLVFKRRRGLYFWSCALASWGVILQPLFIILTNFGVWTDALPSTIMIYLSWLIMVVPQSWVLYSRLHLLMSHTKALRIIKYTLCFNSVAFSVPTIIVGTIAQSTLTDPSFFSINLIWDRVQLLVFFVQEMALSILYIFRTRVLLRTRSPLRERPWSAHATVPASDRLQTSEQKAVLRQLVYANILIIVFEVTLLGIQCANMFQLQGAFKPCVYGIKLKIEFVVLNRLISIVQQPAVGALYLRSMPEENRVPAGNVSRHNKDTDAWHNGDIKNGQVQLEESSGTSMFRSRSAESQARICPGRIN